MADAASSSSGMALRNPSEWATPMIFPGTTQSIAYASFVSATAISSKTREEVYVVTCAPSQCDGTAFPKQTITQRLEMYVCDGDNDMCGSDDDDDDDDDDDARDKKSPVTQIGYPLGWQGEAIVDGTTTQWELSISIIKDNERSSGVTQGDPITFMATTKVGKDVKATTSTAGNLEDDDCMLYQHYAQVYVTAGVDKLLADYPSGMIGQETIAADEFASGLENLRSDCAARAAKTGGGGATDSGSGPKETGSPSKDDDDDDDDDGDKDSSNDDDEDGDKDNGARALSLSAVLMGAFLAIPMLVL